MDSSVKNQIRALFDEFGKSGDSNDLLEALDYTDELSNELKESPFVKYSIANAEKRIMDKLILYTNEKMLWADGKIEEVEELLECSNMLISHNTVHSNDIPRLQDGILGACIRPLQLDTDKIKKCLAEELSKSKLATIMENDAIERKRLLKANFGLFMSIVSRCKKRESLDNWLDYLCSDN